MHREQVRLARDAGDRSLEEVAAKELCEEVGGTFRTLERIGCFYSNSSLSDEECHVFLAFGVGDSLPNPTIPRGAVVAQTPLPGQEVAPETEIRVILSQGPERREVPRVDAYLPPQAERLLRVPADAVRRAHATTPTRTLRNRAPDTPWPTCPAWPGSPLPQFGVPSIT